MTHATEKPFPPEHPETLKEWLWRVKQHEDSIYVRELTEGGKWGFSPLSELPPERWAHHVAGWLEKGVAPVRVIGTDEKEVSDD